MVRRISKSLDVAMADLGKVGGSIGTGAGDIRRDLSKLLRDAKRSTTKMGKATRKDLDRLQKDVTAAAKSNGARSSRKAGARKTRKTTSARKSRSASASKSTRSRAKAATKSRAGSAAKKARTTSTAKKTRASGKARTTKSTR